MIRAGFLSGLILLLLVSVGCRRSPGPPRHAEPAIEGMMPGPAASFDATYVADQRQVKLIDRSVSYEPLDSFRNAAATAAAETGEDEDEDLDGDEDDEDGDDDEDDDEDEDDEDDEDDDGDDDEDDEDDEDEDDDGDDDDDDGDDI